MNELALFAGAGGGVLGGHLLGWRTVCAVEIEDYPRRVLLQRQADGIIPRFPIWDDVCTFDGKPWRGRVDVISGGFPCQDISAAGRGAGLAGARSGLWSEMSRIIGEVRPSYVLVENSPMLVTRGLNRVLADLTSMGYDTKWGIVGADDAGALHQRKRIWILANSNQVRLQGNRKVGSFAKTGNEWERPEPTKLRVFTNVWTNNAGGVCGAPNGVANRVDRFKAIGNGQVPAVVRLAWEILMGEE